MKNEIRTFNYDNGEMQNVQMVILDNWDELNLLKPSFSRVSFDNLCDLYCDYIVKKFALVFGTMILFRLDKNTPIPFDNKDNQYGTLYNPLTVVKRAFIKNIKLKHKALVFQDKSTKDFFELLQQRGNLRIARGKRNTIVFLPVADHFGFLSENRPDAQLKVNSHFFVMDNFDCGSLYDVISSPIGLMIKDGQILNAPLYDREVLMVNQQNEVSINKLNLTQLKITIDGINYSHQNNALYFSRPETKVTPKGGCDLIVVNNEVIAVHPGGRSQVPSCGFVIHLEKEPETLKDRNVYYQKMDEIKFALQVGNSAIVDGKMTESFISRFFDFKKFWTISFPPSMYPLNYKKDRAPRILLGNNADNKPVLLWLEGKGKFGYKVGKESCGASLSESAHICKELNIVNAIHLDGGGSAQILLHNKRSLKISDRNPKDNSEKERAVPYGLIVE